MVNLITCIWFRSDLQKYEVWEGILSLLWHFLPFCKWGNENWMSRNEQSSFQIKWNLFATAVCHWLINIQFCIRIEFSDELCGHFTERQWNNEISSTVSHKNMHFSIGRVILKAYNNIACIEFDECLSVQKVRLIMVEITLGDPRNYVRLCSIIGELKSIDNFVL